MLQIGAQRPPQDLTDLLLECHERIRTFTALAARLARSPGLPSAEVADAAARVRRYFAEALPLHARDEEESLLPRLRGRDPEVDRELGEMRREHETHGPVLDPVVELCGALAAEPSRHAALAPALAAAADALALHFDAHLGREERVIFPAIARHLSAAERAQAIAELRARRR